MGLELALGVFGMIVQAVLLMAFPFALLMVACRIVNSVQDAQLPWTPNVELSALCVGVMAGVILLVENVDAQLLEAGELFRKGGPWDLTFVEFLTGPANPLSYDVSAILVWPLSGKLPTPAGFIVLFLGGLVFYGPILAYRSRRATANAIRNVLIVFWGAYATVYLTIYAGWLVNKLNFWIFFLLLLVLNARRRSEHVVLKIN
ncbi:hypothetical protein ABLE91_18160 [Aquabacter sp. CN5-332]|uniref:hypothetical protein n=1 Tax=Aquabacter sp. CN5-332 TaxID=3156608 RepID=UPI0032B3DC89